MYGYVYKTTNMINGKIYIGQHKSTVFDTDYKGSGVYLQCAIAHYGIENFNVELLEAVESQEELDASEIRLIEEYNSRDLNIGYNIAVGGAGGQNGIHRKRTAETRQKIADSWNRRNRVMSEETRKKLRDSWKNMPDSKKEERARKLSEKLTGRTMSQEIRDKIGDSCRGQKRTEEQRAKMSQAQRNKGPISEEQRERIAKIAKGRIWVHNDSEQKMIYPEEFVTLEALGWTRGRLTFKRNKSSKVS